MPKTRPVVRRQFGDPSEAVHFFSKYPNDAIVIDSVMTMYNAIGTGIRNTSRVYALASNGDLVTVMLTYDNGHLIIRNAGIGIK